MNFVLVRTKLQAVIVLELIRSGELRSPFVFMPLYQFGADEDDASVERLYARISRSAVMTVRVTQETGRLLRNAALLAIAILLASLTRGRLFAAVLNYYALALALKLVPGARFVGFDDGTANTQLRDTAYHSELPLMGSGWKRRVARALFPSGSAAFCRSRIALHYTIYPGRPNVVDASRLALVAPHWSSLLSEADLARLSPVPRTVLLGTVCHGHEPWRARYEWALGHCDAYLPHPREKARPGRPRNVLSFDAPAESAIDHWRLTTATKITVLHFNSSVADSFGRDDRVEFVNLLSGDLPA